MRPIVHAFSLRPCEKKTASSIRLAHTYRCAQREKTTAMVRMPALLWLSLRQLCAHNLISPFLAGCGIAKPKKSVNISCRFLLLFGVVHTVVWHGPAIIAHARCDAVKGSTMSYR